MSDIFNNLWLENEYQKAIEHYENLSSSSKRRGCLEKYNATTKEEYAEKRARQRFEARGL